LPAHSWRAGCRTRARRASRQRAPGRQGHPAPRAWTPPRHRGPGTPAP